MRQRIEVGVIRRSRVKAGMRMYRIIEGQISCERGTCITDAVVSPQIGEWRGASQPRALSEPDVNLSIHPAPIIQPLVPGPSGRTGWISAAEATATIPKPPSYGRETVCTSETPIAR